MGGVRKRTSNKIDFRYGVGKDASGEFAWRNSRQIAALQAQLKAEINQCEDGACVTLDLKVAKSLIDVCRQAKHTEEGHGT